VIQAETRKLAAIMFTDIVGFSRQMGADEARMLRLLDIHNQLISQAVTNHHGQIIKTIGDAFLVDFPSVVHAVQCAQQVHAQLRAYNAEKESAEQIHVRIGIHLGDIVQKDGDVFGDGVNIASRLQNLAEPDTICISDIVYRDVAKKLDLGTVVSLGKPKLKNIAERFPVYALLPAPPTGLRQRMHVQQLKLSHRLSGVPRLAMVALIAGGLLTTQAPFFFSIRNPQSPIHNQAALPLPDKPSIVVLPFANMSNDPSQDYFSDGITEDITTDLSKISSLFVIARNSAFTYKGKPVKVQEVSKELGVHYVLEGSVRKAGDQVRITAQLIDATTGGHLWSQRYDRPLKDIFALQDEIVQKIVTTLRLQLTLQEQGYTVGKTTDQLEAYDHFLRGLEYYYRAAKEDILRARQMFEKAIALDPQYALAYAYLGLTYHSEWALGPNPNAQTLEQALAMGQQAVALDDSLPVAHALLGRFYASRRQYDQALAEDERAIVLDPNNADSYATQAEVLSVMGRPEDALQAVEQAMRLNPRATRGQLFNLALAYYLMGRYTEAIPPLKSLLARNPNFLIGYYLLSISYTQQWHCQQSQDPQTLTQAWAAAQRAAALNPSYRQGHEALGMVYLFQRQYGQAIAALEQALTFDSSVAGSYAILADTLGRAGKVGEALQMIEQALRHKPLIVDLQFALIGSAYYFAGKSEEAIAPLQRHLRRYPNRPDAHLTLAAVYSELGQTAQARAEAAEVLRLNPKFSLEVHKERVPIKDPAMLERHIAALRKAGLK
jgi:adenylate cyclase